MINLKTRKMIKKFLLGFTGLLMCFLFTSCGNPISKMESLVKDIEKNGDEWTKPDQWDEALVIQANCLIDFINSDPTEDEYEAFKEAIDDLGGAMSDLTESKAERARDKAISKFEKNHKDLQKDFDKAMRKFNRLGRKFDD